tara:strand:+ start:73 stop:885 length:813 start_codon:yes stop_codon:yes gene_type:complete
MDLASAGVLGNWRPDELAHMSRFDKIASLAIEESKLLGRPLDTLEIGCGECWSLRVLYKAYVIKKSDVIRSYYGYDIDPACQLENPFWSNGGGELEESTWFKNFNGEIRIQDLTTNPILDLPDESIDFFWSTEVIEHMGREFVPAWLDEAARVMRPDAIAYISTPNHDGSNDKLPEDHVYEWGFQELKEELERNFRIEAVTGTFIQMPKLKKAMHEDNYTKDYDQITHTGWSMEQLITLQERFGKQFLRMAAAVFYPEVANNCAWRLVKK